MTFKIVSVGWSCADFLERTLESVEAQTVEDWEMWITYDPSDDHGAWRIKDWCESHGPRFNYTLNTVQQWAVRNQVETIQRLNPADDDIIVFLDLDGDQLAHTEVLERLSEHYADDTLLTYGSYEPVPYAESCIPATPFPQHIVDTANYRQHMLTAGCCFNHLRTMKGRVFNHIPLDQFHWQQGPLAGQWYEAGTDYIFMVAGLELADGRYKCIEETLLLYNNANPKADYIVHPADSAACTQDYLHRPKLARLP